MAHPHRYFSETFETARHSLVDAAVAAGAQHESYPLTTTRGPGGTPLSMDTLRFGPADAETMLLNTSGTHGAEGYGGSAAQLAWVLEGGPNALPDGIAVLLVHAVNPYGFAWGLRGTENNVDLNRNFLDHAQPHPKNPLYADLHPLLCPKRMDDAAMRTLLAEGARLIERHGQWAMEDAISRGQYSHPDGFHFGGTAPEWSNRTIGEIVRKECASAKRVGFVDWHSGPVGDGELIYLCFSPPGSAELARASDWWGRDNLCPEKVDELWGSKRPTRCGILFWGIEALLRPRATVTGAVIEFRSAVPKKDPATALRVAMLERWLRFEGGLGAPEAPAFFEEIREEYAPRRRSWQENVIVNALASYEQTLAGLEEWARA